MKKLLIRLIKLYQKKAPERLRQACLFQPSCSNYMILAIEKYGVVVGIGKGIKRLLRCRPPNGGEDYP
jgi:putative membrane protein insertion efficiency factor